ncbi:5-formyltetrahydrofolate cyclo-ligase [Pilatotrama ljubarskyi]|nr:5-formyltetrahydrofolate cyclo-ligase [Pilatotrama ljubarskyi]
MASTLTKQKGALRKAMRATLANLTSDEIQAQSRQITRTLLALPEFQQSKNVSCFLSMPAGEVDTSAVVSAVFDAGKTLYVPKMLDKDRGIMDFLQIFGEDDLRTLPSGQWGIREPDELVKGKRRPSALSGSAEPLDLIVMPGMAFDQSLSRLGYGKGFYDRFLSSYAAALHGRQQARPRLVALALREQILEAGEVPVGEADWKVDVIIGPDGIVS